MAINEQYRICPATGLRVYRSAENLIKANAVIAIIFLAIGGLFGLMVALTRWKAVHLLPAEWFYLVLTAHGLNVLVVWIIFFGTLVIAKQERTYEGSVPLVTFGAVTAAIIAVFTIASGAIILIPTFLWSIGLVSHIDTLMYRTVFWAFGHASQQINVAAHISVWYLIAAVTLGAKPF